MSAALFLEKIEQGIAQKLYREDINIESYVTFYFNLIFSIKESTSSEEESQKRIRNFRIPLELWRRLQE
jgi:hypothetical protein